MPLYVGGSGGACNQQFHSLHSIPLSYIMYSSLRKITKEDFWVVTVVTNGSLGKHSYSGPYCEKYRLLVFIR